MRRRRVGTSNEGTIRMHVCPRQHSAALTNTKTMLTKTMPSAFLCLASDESLLKHASPVHCCNCSTSPCKKKITAGTKKKPKGVTQHMLHNILKILSRRTDRLENAINSTSEGTSNLPTGVQPVHKRRAPSATAILLRKHARVAINASTA